MIILDTNVLSAMMRPADNPAVIDWLNRQSTNLLWTTVITVMEIRYGILQMAIGRRRNDVANAFERAIWSLGGRIFDFDYAAAEDAAKLSAQCHGAGRNVGVPDTQIAGIALSRKATLATRNVRDFRNLEIPLVDPWA